MPPRDLFLDQDPLNTAPVPQKKGTLLSFLDWWDRPGQVVRNAASGNFSGAARQGLDIFGDVVDAAIPFVDAIPEASRPEDWISGGEFLGVKDPSIGKTALDVGVGLATDPWTYLSFGAVPLAAKLGRAAATAGKVGVPAAAASRALAVSDDVARGATHAAEPLTATIDDVARGADDGLRDASLATGAKPVEGGGFHFRVPFTDVSTRQFLQGHDVDPLSLVGKAGNWAYGKLPEQTQKAVSHVGMRTRQVFGAERLGTAAKDLLSKAGGARFAVSKAGLDESRRILGQLPENEQMVVGDIIDNYRWEMGRNGKATLVGALDKDGVMSAVERVSLHPEVTPDNAQRIREAVYGIVGNRDGKGFSRRQAEEGLDLQIFERPEVTGAGPDVVNGKPMAWQGGKSSSRDLGIPQREVGEATQWSAYPADDAARAKYGMEAGPDGAWRESTGLDAFDEEYLARQLRGVKREGTELEELMARNSPIASRKLKTWQQTKSFLEAAENTGVTYERSALKRLAQRADDQGRMAGQAEIGRKFGGESFALANDDAVRAVKEKIARELPPEEAQVMLDAFQGLERRGAVMDTLATANRYMKPYMVYGAVLPKLGSVVRNRVGGVWQAFSDPNVTAEARRGMIKRLGTDLSDAFTQSLGLKNLKAGELSNVLEQVDEAFKTSGGVAKVALSKMPKEIAEAMERGVLDGFVSSEELLKEIARTGGLKKFQSIVDWPGKIFRGVEDRMRLGMYLDLTKSGKSADEAAQIVKDSLYDYKVSSIGNRRARDLIPFWQFTAKAVPQQAKFLSKNPAVPVGLSGLYGGSAEDPVYPWMAERASIGLGNNENGDPMYMTGLGLPVEALNALPNPFAANSLSEFGRDVERTAVGSSQPLLKTAYSTVSNRDPYFGTDAGTYDKVPFFGPQGEAGRAYNKIAGSGLIAPLDAPLRVLDDIFDAKKPLGARALDVLTGAQVVTVDEDKALQQQLTAFLERNPDVASSRNLYSRSNDPQTQAVIAHLKQVKERMRKKREAEGGL